jgi:hypothetical protein
LHDPDARHVRAGVGHAISTDLTDWQRTADALVRSEIIRAIQYSGRVRPGRATPEAIRWDGGWRTLG